MNTYTSHISVYDLLLLGTIFIGLTFSALLAFTKSINRHAKQFLSLALVVMVLWVAPILAIDLQVGDYHPHWSRLPLQFSLALGPLIYFYVLKLTRPEYKFRPKDLLHFIPALLEQAILLNVALQFLVPISMITYLYCSHRLIEQYYRRQKFNRGDRYRAELRWLHKLLAGFGLLWLLWIPYTAIGYFYYQHQLNIQLYYPFYLAVTAMLVWMTATAYLRPGAVALVAPAPSLKPPLPSEMKQMGAWLKKAVQTGLYYQDPELTLVSLAETLGLTTHELSRIINTVLKKSFNDFINEFRVVEAARKMQDPAYDNITLLGIAFESGFNSKSTFNRAFRQMTGKSAAEYKSELKKERPFYNLTRDTQFAAIISYQQATPEWSNEKLNYNGMFRNYLKIAFRSFWKRKVFTFINIVGLSIGISASLVIYLIVNYDFTFDKFEKDSDRIFRVVTNFKFQGNESHAHGVVGPLAAGIKNTVTGVDIVVHLFTLSPDVTVLNKHNEPVKFKAQDQITLADQNYFKLIPYKWLAGSSATALNDPYQVVLTSAKAKLYFPALSYGQMIGKTVTYDTLKTTVSGIVETIKENTDFSFHDFISFSSVKPKTSLARTVQPNNWGSTNGASEVFIKVSPGVSAANIQAQVNALYKRNNPQSPDDLKNGYSTTYTVQPLSDLHFDQVYGTFDFSSAANKTRSYLLLVIAGFLLILGCINFINLSTAQATQRAKEIGIRKTMGSSRIQLVVQFLSETFLITIFAVIVSIGLTPVILNLFSDFIAPGVTADFIHQPGIFLFLLMLTVVVSILSGFYPALLLSGYKPVLVLKNQAQSNNRKTRNAWLRKSLTVSQFVIAQFFIMATMLVSKQIYYALHKDLGFKKDAIVFIIAPFKHTTGAINKTLANQLRELPGIEMVSLGLAPPSADPDSPTEVTNTTNVTYRDGKKEITTSVELKYGDENYTKLFHIKILAGRNIQAGDTTTGLLINDMYAKTLGFRNPADAVGKILYNMRIVGVTGDFYEHSMQSPITPMMLLSAGNKAGLQTGAVNIALKPETTAGDWQKTIAAMGKVWKENYPDDDFNYQFFDKSIEQYYGREEQTSTLLTWATGLSILISCLGLLGLAIYTTGQRTKEVGIRKVLGASVSQIVSLLSRELVLLILVAFVIVTPMAWLAMNKWMESYADKTSVSWWIFATSGVGMLLVAFITSSFQTIKAAVVNPVRSLRSE